MRSGGLQLYVDRRGAAVLDAIKQSKAFNDALEQAARSRGRSLPKTSCAATAWTSGTRSRMTGTRCIDGPANTRSAMLGLPFDTEEEEGFFQLATTQPAPGAKPADKDLYVHEVIARWAGWSLSVPFPAKSLSRFADPGQGHPAGWR